MDLQIATQHLRLLSDSTRLRLLFLLETEELSVAELAAITQLAQPRVSTHLARLKEARLVNDRRDGVSVFYRLASEPEDPALAGLWQVLKEQTLDPLAEQDLERIPQVLAARSGGGNWADTVAGDMERHYSPGRTWEATGRALAQLLSLGDVLDIASGDGAMADLLAPRARSVTCIDLSERVTEAGQQRLSSRKNVRFEQGDMHELPLTDQSIDTVLLLHALTYTNRPDVVFREVHRVLRKGGAVLAVTLARHRHEKAVEPYGHRNLGFEEKELREICGAAELEVVHCAVDTVEKRSPNFAVITLLARRKA